MMRRSGCLGLRISCSHAACFSIRPWAALPGSALVAFLGAMIFGAAPAAAQMHLCNQTSYVLYAAIGFQSGMGMSTRGWSRIAPGDCALTISEPLTAPAYYVYAKSSQAHSGPARAWGGQTRLCTKNTDFSLQTPFGAPSCGSDDTFLMPFAAVSTRGSTSWTTTFTENPRLESFLAAREAGTARLLSDIGYKVDLGGTKTDADALAKFRAHAKLAANASPDDIFDALETEALKASAPQGYSICNDADSVVWAAMGLQQGANLLARGWWKISPGTCAKTIAEPLAADHVYLFAEKHGNSHLVSGPAKFCITDIEFEIYGNQRCSARGLTEAGFAVTNTKGVSGYAAHVGSNGLIPSTHLLSQAHTPK